MTTSGLPKVIIENIWTEFISNSQRQKAIILTKVEPEKRKVIFRQEVLLPQKSEVDLILALNKALQKAGISTYT